MLSFSNIAERWLHKTQRIFGCHVLLLFKEKCNNKEIINGLNNILKGHYISSSILARQVRDHGEEKTAEIIKYLLPLEPKARSGDFGEIVAAEIAECHLGFTVPVRKLQYKDDRNMSLRGDDIIAIMHDDQSRLVFLKGESKCHETLSKSVVSDAFSALEKNDGRPNRHSVLFIANLLRRESNDNLATEMEDAVLSGFTNNPVKHMLFVLTGSNPELLLVELLNNIVTSKQTCYAVGVRICNHRDFINSVYGDVPDD